MADVGWLMADVGWLIWDVGKFKFLRSGQRA